jgi:hypothetical protein
MHQRIDMAKVDESDVDGDFLSLPDFSRSRVSVSASDLFLSTIHMDGIWMVNSPFAIRNLQKWAKPQLHSNSLIVTQNRSFEAPMVCAWSTASSAIK